MVASPARVRRPGALAVHCSMWSGGTSIRRSAPSITLWNTGADTMLP